jgi:uncharacterized protein
MLVDELKARMFKAMKAGNVVEKEILKVAIGEITTDAVRPGRQGSDEEAVAILRKLIKSNEESLAHLEDESQKATLRQENEVLASFLPKTLDPDAIVVALEPVIDRLRAAANDGQATGIAMQQLKGAPVSGKDVAAVVKKLRG